MSIAGGQWELGSSIKSPQVRERRSKTSLNGLVKAGSQEDVIASRHTSSLQSVAALVSAQPFQLPGQLPHNIPSTYPPSNNLPPPPPRGVADDSIVRYETAEIISKEDTVHPSLIREDAFDKAFECASMVHHKQVDELRKQVEQLKERLNTVLCSTWGFSEATESLQGVPVESNGGALTLLQSGSESVHTDFGGTVLHEVSEDVHAQHQIQTTSQFKIKTSWSGYSWRASIRNNALEKLDLQKRAMLEEYDAERRGNRCAVCQKLIVHPANPVRLCWDVAAMVFLLYDIIVIPLGAYNPERTWFLDGMDWVTLSFWSIDMVFAFFTGYVHAGVVVLDSVSIAAHYMSFWFWLDLATVGPEWFFVIIALIVGESDTGGAGDATGLIRVVRVVRILRLLRMAKMKRFLSALKDRIQSEAVFLIWSVFQFIILLLFANHFIAAGWYLVGDIAVWQGIDNWIDGSGLKDAGLVTRYTSSLHWSLTQFALGWMGVSPHNSGESIFSIFVLLAGMITFCCFIAAVTDSMEQLHNMKAESSRQFWLLRRYLREQRVPNALRTRILRYLEYASTQKQDLVPEAYIPILDMLSDNLRSELKYVVHFGSLLIHPLFRYAESLSEVVMHNLVEDVLSQKQLAVEDVEFQVSTMATHMSMVVSGQMAYHRSGDPVLKLSRDDWVCEAAIWVSWACRGNLVAESDAQLIMVECKTFIETIQGDAQLMPLLTCYAEVFAEWLNKCPPKDLSDVSFASKQCRLVESFIEKAKVVRIDHERKAEKEEEKEEKRAEMRRAQSQQSGVAITDVND